MRLFDITRPIRDGMAVYEDDPPVSIRPVHSVAAGAPANVSEVRLGSHTGTHVDPPLHLFDGAPGVDRLSLHTLIGPARVYELDVRGQIDSVDLDMPALSACHRALFKTSATPAAKSANDAPRGAGLTASAAHALVAAGIRLVGVDGASVDPPGAVDFPAHRALLAAGIIVLEGLDLAAVPPGLYELLCLPLKILGGDGAPARVVLRSAE